MKKIFPFLAYAASVFVSHRFLTEYWVVGPVFGVALLLANPERVFKKLSFQHLLFLGASTLIYALVLWISNHGWKFREEGIDMLFGSTSAAIAVGSLLLPSVHALLFGTDFKTVRSVSLALILSWYGTLLLSWLDETIGIKPPIDYSLVALALWQGIYLKRLKPASG